MDFIDICNNPEKFLEQERRDGVCDDDYEYTAPYIDMCPDDKFNEEPSFIKIGGKIKLIKK